MKDDGHHRRKYLGKFTLTEVFELIVFSPCLIMAAIIALMIIIICGILNLIFSGGK